MNLKSNLIKMGRDYLITVTGGQAHIGAVVLAEPYEKNGQIHATLSTLTRPAHKDDVIACQYARAVCQASGNCCTAVCGIHYDEFDADLADEIQKWISLDICALLKQIS